MKTIRLAALCLGLSLSMAAAAGERVYTYQLTVDASGRVERLVSQAPTNDAQAANVAAQVRQWRFEPGVAGQSADASTYLRVIAREQGEGMAIIDAHTGPRPVSLAQPAYPQDDQRRGREGVVVLKLDLDAAGNVSDARVQGIHGDVSRGMGEAALAAAKGWRFEPERVGGQARAASVLMPVCFASDAGEGMCAWTGPGDRRHGSRELVSLTPVLRPSDAGQLFAGR